MVPTDPQSVSNEDDEDAVSASDVETRDGDPELSNWLADIAHAPDVVPKERRRLKPDDIVAERYVVLKVLGAGGMGVVYEATDTKLQRNVALKTHQCGSERARLKLIAEARAMAKLSHPNVVAVHDVGEFAGGVFLAADLVRGTTLRDWDAAAAGWRATVRVYADAGRGLAAAHALQLVHRDFKPENVLVDEEGRCLVTDFGLAALLGDASEPPSLPGIDTVSAERSKASTHRGWAGTPSYMAPEQFLRGKVDARSDQFSFCVGLYEALFGRRPFGTTSLTLPEAGIGPPPASAKVKVPGRVYRALRRGLRSDASDRFADMNALLAELDAATQPRRILSLAALALGGAGAILGGWSALAEDTVSCELDDAPFSAWGEGSRNDLEVTFAASPEPARVWPAVARSLDAFADDWRGSWRETCLARDKVEAPETVASFRCLTESSRQLEVALRRLHTGSDALRADGLARTARLLQPIECLDPDFAAAAPLYLSAPLTSAIGGVRESLYQVHEDTSRDVPGQLLGARLEEIKRNVDLIDDPALEAAYRWTEVAVALRNDSASAVEPLKLAYHNAREGGQHHIATLASASLGRLLGEGLGQTEAGLVWAEVASAEARQDGVPVATAIEAQLALAIAYDVAGRWSEADRSYTAALLQAKELPPETAAYTRAGILTSVSGFEGARGNTEAALDTGREALAIFEDLYGGPTKESLNVMTNIGLALHGAQRSVEAKALFEQEHRHRVALFGADDRSSIAVLINLGMVETALGNEGDGRRYYADADRVVVKHHGEEHPDRALIATNLAYVESIAGNEEAAMRLEERAVTLLAATSGPTAEPTLLARLALARSGRRLGELDAPCATYDDVATLARQSLGATRVLARAVRGQGDCALARDEIERAQELLREGVQISKDVSEPPDIVGLGELRLADAMWKLEPSAAQEARAMATLGLQHLKQGVGNEDDIARAQAWLDEHPSPPPSQK